MATQDISRHLLQPKKHYSSLHLQQGRVIVDSDWNERAGLEAEDLRQTILDIACARGTTNDGFAVTISDVPGEPDANVVLPSGGGHVTYDFDIGGGSYYVGGMRLAIDNGDDSSNAKETFLGQSDWLQITSLAANMPSLPATGAGTITRYDLVYLYAWEQPVTAVEDSELQEVALGRRDTSTRVKRMRRFVVKPNVLSDDCATEFDNLMTELQETDLAKYEPETGELVSAGRLRVLSTSQPAVEDPCADPTSSGYVGADNQTIRVELRPGAEVGFDGKLIWGFDNASKLYRVQVSGTTVTFLTPPADIASMPRAGQVVEFLQWGAKLPNGEKVAETQGLVTVVTGSYDPPNKTCEIEGVAELTDWNQWLTDHTEHYKDPADPLGVEKYLYLRIWNRGSETTATASAALVDYVVGTPVDLGDTGLQVVVEADGKDGDYWIVAARPSTPDVVTPWDLGETGGVAPHGPRRFYAPLGLIAIVDTDPLSYAASDCRTKLRQLCEGGACTVTVGDGKKSFGQFKTLQDAVDAVGNGSKICVLPGDYEGHTVISGFDGLIIEGCGVRSILRSPEPTEINTDFKAFQNPIVSINDSKHVFIRDLAFLGYSAVGVEIGADPDSCEKIQLENLTMHSTGAYTSDSTGATTSWWLPAPCITVASGSRVEILNCHIGMADMLSFSFAVVLGGDDLSVRGCTVTADAAGRISGALSGINIRSGSRGVEVIDCDIRGGWGHGIALGHGREYLDPGTPGRDEVFGENVTMGVAETSVLEGEEPSDCECDNGRGVSSFDALDSLTNFLPAGPVEDVRIYDNRISEMGLSGISTTLFWPSTVSYGALSGTPVFIVVTDIDIARNVIEGNAKLDLPPEGFVNYDVAVGGICLAASTNAWIHENTIRNNGTTFLSMPICGVGMLAAMNAVIEDNQIVNNGVRKPAGDEVFEQRGLRGGIAIYEATAIRTKAKSTTGEMPTFPRGNGSEIPLEGEKDWTGASSQSAVTVRGNEVVQMFGRALWIARGFGPIVVTGNTLQSYGSMVLDGVPGASLRWMYNDGAGDGGSLTFGAAGACVEVSNYALSEDKPWADPPPTPTFPALDFVDPGQDEIYGGSVLVSGNRMHLEWERHGGWPSSVLVQSVGSVVFNSNASEVVMGNDFGTDDMWVFAKDVCGQEHAHTFVVTNVFVAGMASVSLLGNRLVEPKWDAVFSAFVGYPALPLDTILIADINASLANSNIGSHCIVALDDDTTAFREHNVEIYGLDFLVGSTPYSCANIAVLSDGVSNQSRLVTASMQLAYVVP